MVRVFFIMVILLMWRMDFFFLRRRLLNIEEKVFVRIKDMEIIEIVSMFVLSVFFV